MQVENIILAQDQNDEICFSCLHYSVLESSGKVRIALKKKVDTEIKFGVRTIADTAIAGSHFKAHDEQYTFKKTDKTMEIED